MKKRELKQVVLGQQIYRICFGPLAKRAIILVYQGMSLSKLARSKKQRVLSS
jgi:hypothetical protein